MSITILFIILFLITIIDNVFIFSSLCNIKSSRSLIMRTFILIFTRLILESRYRSILRIFRSIFKSIQSIILNINSIKLSDTLFIINLILLFYRLSYLILYLLILSSHYFIIKKKIYYLLLRVSLVRKSYLY